MSDTFKLALKTLGWTAALAGVAAAVGGGVVVGLDYFFGVLFIHGTVVAAVVLNACGLLALWHTRQAAGEVGAPARAGRSLRSLLPRRVPGAARVTSAWSRVYAGARRAAAAARPVRLPLVARARVAAAAPMGTGGGQKTDTRRALAAVHSVIWGVPFASASPRPRRSPHTDGGFRHAPQE